MKRLSILGLAVLLSLPLFASCHKGDTVSAEYQPEPAPDAIEQLKLSQKMHDIDGELRGVDLQAKTIVVRLENGMDQTFTWDESTIVMGVPSSEGDAAKQGKKMSETDASLSALAIREHPMVEVSWRDNDGGSKFATSINVEDMSAKLSKSKAKKKPKAR